MSTEEIIKAHTKCEEDTIRKDPLDDVQAWLENNFDRYLECRDFVRRYELINVALSPKATKYSDNDSAFFNKHSALPS